MITIARITYGCRWSAAGHVVRGPVRVVCGAIGPEVTVEQMLEGRGHTQMLPCQLADLLRDMVKSSDAVVELAGEVPAGLKAALSEIGCVIRLVV
jgi:hypothetical protein